MKGLLARLTTLNQRVTFKRIACLRDWPDLDAPTWPQVAPRAFASSKPFPFIVITPEEFISVRSITACGRK
jgi:hypothetical protein